MASVRSTEAIDLLRHYGEPIRPYLDDGSVTEIAINRYDEIWLERDGALERTEARWRSEDELLHYIKLIANSLGQEVDPQVWPILDARLDDNTRINAVLRPVAVRGHCMSIRPYPKLVLGIDDLIARGALTERMVELVKLAVEARRNILISGGTGSGKTTIFRCLCRFVHPSERVITVEDTAENLLPDHPHVVALEAPKRRRDESRLQVTMGLLIENTLRMRPDRPLVGEMRSGEAMTAFIDAINTGASGLMATLHANSALDALNRCDVLYAREAGNLSMEVVRSIVRGNIDLVVHVTRELVDGRWVRRVKELLWLQDHARPTHLVRHHRTDGYSHDAEATQAFKNMLPS